MLGTLQGKVAVVTGAGSGLGRATSLAFAREGAKVVVADLDVNNGQQTLQMIQRTGGLGLFIEVDVTSEAAVKMLISKTLEAYGQLNCAHNNVGIEDHSSSLIECTAEQWDRVINVNLKSVWLCMKHEIIHMIKHGGGTIVNTSSEAGLVATPNIAAYVASKHGVNGLTKAAALEFAKTGIRVNAVCPGGMIGTGIYQRVAAKDPEFLAKKTAERPIARDATPEEVAKAVLWLCSDKSSYITGHCMPVDGGYTVQ